MSDEQNTTVDGPNTGSGHSLPQDDIDRQGSDDAGENHQTDQSQDDQGNETGENYPNEGAESEQFGDDKNREGNADDSEDSEEQSQNSQESQSGQFGNGINESYRQGIIDDNNDRVSSPDAETVGGWLRSNSQTT